MKKIILLLSTSILVFAETNLKLGYNHYDNNDYVRTSYQYEILNTTELNCTIDTLESSVKVKNETTNSSNNVDKVKLYAISEKKLNDIYGVYSKLSYYHNPFDGYTNQYRVALGVYFPYEYEGIKAKIRLGYVNSQEQYVDDTNKNLNLARVGFILDKKLGTNIRFKSVTDFDKDIANSGKYLESTNSIIFNVNKNVAMEIVHEYTWTSNPILDNKPREINILTNLVLKF